MRYMRIPANKFWGWVIASMLIGLAVGLIAMFVSGVSSANRIAALQAQLSGAGADTGATATAAEARAQSAEATVAALTDQVAQLTADLGTANSTIATLKGTSTSTPSDTSTDVVTISSRSITPSSVASTGTITLIVKVKGHPDKVQMRIVGLSPLSFDLTYNLKRSSTSGSTETWKRVMDAPTKAGTYRYTASALVGGVRTNSSGATLTFKVR